MKAQHCLALALFFSGTVLAEIPAGWSTNLDATLAEAMGRKQPVLAFFTASWCGPCKMMVRSTLKDESVVETLGAFSCVAVDVDEQASLARRHEISSVPTFKVLSHEGGTVALTSGFQPPEAFVQWLADGLGAFAAFSARRQAAVDKLAEVNALIEKGDGGSVSASVAMLFDLCAQKDGEVRQAAITNLTALAQRQPVALLAGLEHPRLAARIQAANLLRARLGEAFDADPWSDEATRKRFIVKWRERLGESQP